VGGGPGTRDDFRLTLTDTGRTLRIEVTADARTDGLPATDRSMPPGEQESGRGLLLVGAPAHRGGVTPGPTTTRLGHMGIPAPADQAPGGAGQPLRRTREQAAATPRPGWPRTTLRPDSARAG
jgi:hypothetical protein